MKKFAILALASAIALPASAAGVTISGYIDAGYADIQAGAVGSPVTGQGQASGATNGTQNTSPGFQLNEVNIDLSSQLTSDISAFVSMDWINGGGNAGANVGLDYAYVDFSNPGPFDLNLRMGRIPSVIGVEQRMSESPQTKFINLSLLSPILVGSQDGVAIYGSFSPVNYAFALSNADNVGNQNLFTLAGADTAIQPQNNNGSALVTGLNNNNDYAVSGRLGVVPVEGLEVGVSGSLDIWSNAGGAAGQINRNPKRTTLAADASYQFGAFGVKAEYAAVDEQQIGAIGAAGSDADVDLRGFYVEGTWDISSKYSLGVRYNTIEIEQAGPQASGASSVISDYSTFQIAGVYRIADNVHFKAEYDVNDEDVVNRGSGSNRNDQISNDAFSVSLVGAF